MKHAHGLLWRRALAVSLALAPAIASAIPEGPAWPSPEWYARELMSWSTPLREAPVDAAAQPEFLQAVAQSPNSPPLGDPLATPNSPGRNGKLFFDNEALVEQVYFSDYSSDCLKLSGHVWRPRNLAPGTRLPAVAIVNGYGGSEYGWWWAAQTLVRGGYMVITFDARGDGASQKPPTGSDSDNTRYWRSTVDAIDFLRSSPERPNANDVRCGEPANFNPQWEYVDLTSGRLGVAGHSAGAAGAVAVGSYDAKGGVPWPGHMDDHNPVAAVVAWDNLGYPYANSGTGFETLPLIDEAVSGPYGAGTPRTFPRVPTMGQTSDYRFTPTPLTRPPNADTHKRGFFAFREAGVPVYEIGFQGSQHSEWMLVPGVPDTHWCPRIEDHRCVYEEGRGLPMAQHYTLAWFDRWLKKSGEVGYDSADERLLNDGGYPKHLNGNDVVGYPQGPAPQDASLNIVSVAAAPPHECCTWQDRMSFYWRSARFFPDRNGAVHNCDDIRAGCPSSNERVGDIVRDAVSPLSGQICTINGGAPDDTGGCTPAPGAGGGNSGGAGGAGGGAGAGGTGGSAGTGGSGGAMDLLWLVVALCAFAGRARMTRLKQ